MNIDYKLEGVDEVVANLRAFGARVQTAAGNAIYNEAEFIMTDSKDNYVPVDQGILKSSGHVLEPVIENSNVIVRLVFGGLAKAYAIIQHERLDFKHRVGSAKYLELPLMAWAKNGPSRIAASLRGQLFGFGGG